MIKLEAYILYKIYIRRLEGGNHKYRFLCDYLLYKKHLQHMDFSCTMVDILFWLTMPLDSRIFHR